MQRAEPLPTDAAAGKPPRHKSQLLRKDFEVKQQAALARSEYRQDLIEAKATENRQIENFSKSMLAVSGVSLGFSLSYAEFVKEPYEVTGWLYSAWIFFSLSVVFTVLAFYHSSSAFRLEQERLRARLALEDWRALEIYNAYKERRERSAEGPVSIQSDLLAETERVEEASECVRLLNQLSLGAFVIGLLGLIWFSIVNFQN